ncbi:MAG TPA: carnitine dehydratase, partial [Myxococcales bacterium]|nr:carnitine dehydratase [Myxococcales bacterium]
ERDRAGHDINFLARSGLSHHIGRTGQGPVPLATLIGDVAGGTWPAVTGILAALIHRQQSGEGQFIDISMADGSLLMNTLAITQALHGGGDLGPEQHSLSGATVYDYYQCADGRWLAVGALEDKFYAQLLEGLDLPDLADQWMAHGKDAQRQKTQVADAIRSKPLAHWRAVFSKLDCCVEPVCTPSEVIADPLFHHREMLVDVPTADGDAQTQVGNPIQLRGSPPTYRHTGPLTGQDSEEVLRKAGLSDAEIANLKESGALG